MLNNWKICCPFAGCAMMARSLTKSKAFSLTPSCSTDSWVLQSKSVHVCGPPYPHCEMLWEHVLSGLGMEQTFLRHSHPIFFQFYLHEFGEIGSPWRNPEVFGKPLAISGSIIQVPFPCLYPKLRMSVITWLSSIVLGFKTRIQI